MRVALLALLLLGSTAHAQTRTTSASLCEALGKSSRFTAMNRDLGVAKDLAVDVLLAQNMHPPLHNAFMAFIDITYSHPSLTPEQIQRIAQVSCLQGFSMWEVRR